MLWYDLFSCWILMEMRLGLLDLKMYILKCIYRLTHVIYGSKCIVYLKGL